MSTGRSVMRSLKPVIGLGVLAVCAAAAGADLQSCPPAGTRTIVVTGTAAVRVPPDRVSFSVGVETEAPSVAKAVEANSAKVAGLLAALRRKGVDTKQMQTSNVDITSRDRRDKKLPGFRVTNVVTVTLEDPGKAAEVLHAAVSAGANQMAGLRFFVGNPGGLRKRGLELAFQDAKAKAELLAGLAKQSLGNVVCVSEAGSPATDQYDYRGYTARNRVQVPVEAGIEEVNFGVGVVFELK